MMAAAGTSLILTPLIITAACLALPVCHTSCHFLHVRSFHTLANSNTTGKIIPILQMRNLRLRELKYVAQDQT